jgi:hypothetical protein
LVTLNQKNVFRALVVVIGNMKKLEAGFVATRRGRFEVLVDLKHSELVLGGLHGGSRARPEGPRHFKQMVYNGLDASTAERANGGRHDGSTT